MGITISPYTTTQGITLSSLYLSVTNMRMQPCGNGMFHSVLIFSGWLSRDQKMDGYAPVALRLSESVADVVLPGNYLNSNFMFVMCYQTAIIQLTAAGYTVANVFEAGQQDMTQYIYDASGYSWLGFNSSGYNQEGFNSAGYNLAGFNSAGYNSAGYNSAGFNSSGFNSAGYNQQGYNHQGYNGSGYDISGYDCYGYDISGWHMIQSYNEQGLMPDGTIGSFPALVNEYNTLFPNNTTSINQRFTSQAQLNSIMAELQAEITAILPGTVISFTFGTATPTNLHCNWSVPSTGGSVTGYKVYYSVNSNMSSSTQFLGTITLDGSSNGSAIIGTGSDGALTPLTTYYITVTATNASGTGSVSSIFNDTTLIPVPGQVSVFNFGTATTTNLPCSWSVPSTGGPITGYTLNYSVNSDMSSPTQFLGTVTLDGSSNGSATIGTGSDGVLTLNTPYYVTVTATGEGGTGSTSSIFNATTASS